MLSEDMFVDAKVCEQAWTQICRQAIKQRADCVRGAGECYNQVCSTHTQMFANRVLSTLLYCQSTIHLFNSA